MDKIRVQVAAEGREVEQGEVFATPSFQLNTTTHILHAAVINYNPGVKQFAGKPSLHTIETILENCIPYFQYFTDKQGYPPTAVFPYLGCGVGGLDKSDVRGVFENFVNTSRKDIDGKMVLVDYDN